MNKIFFTFADGHVESFFAFGDVPKMQEIAKDWWVKNGELAEIVHGAPISITWRSASGSERMEIVNELNKR